MAKVLKSFNFKSGFGRKNKYPWTEWMDGRIWEIKQGEDFSVQAKSMAQQVWKCAKESGKKAQVRIIGNRIIFKAGAAKQQGADHVEVVAQAQ